MALLPRSPQRIPAPFSLWVTTGSVENTRSHVETGKQSSQKPRDFRVQRRAFDRFEHSTLVEFSTEPVTTRLQLDSTGPEPICQPLAR